MYVFLFEQSAFHLNLMGCAIELLPRQGCGVIEAPAYPSLKCCLISECTLIHKQPALHRATCDIEDTSPGLVECRIRRFRIDPNNQASLPWMPQLMFPWRRKASPPNIFFSDRPWRLPTIRRTRSARCSSNAMGIPPFVNR